MKLSVDGCIRRSVWAAFAAGIASAAAPTFAQDTAPAATTVPETAPAPEAAPAAAPATKAVELKAVQVTGSRIKAPNLTSSSPITTVGAQEIKFQGTTRVEDLLNSLPQVFADQGGNLANGATGTATVDLRDLGSSRTLVLIDGKRVQPGDPGDSTADLNFIPAALIDRVDVLTGGASATYGADAVAGVVNFVMKKNFEGVRIEAQRGIFNHKNDSQIGDVVQAKGFTRPAENKWDGQSWDLAAVIGTNTADGKGNVSAYATYRQIDPIDQGQRDFSACALSRASAPTGARPNDFICGGSGTSATGQILGNYDGAYTLDTSGPGNTFRPFAATDVFNFNPYNYFQRNDERYTLGAFGHYEINKHAEVYSQVMFMDDRTNAVIAPSGAFGVAVTIDRDNPLISQQQEDLLFQNEDPTAQTTDTLILRRNVEGGGRDSDLRHNSFRIVGGIKGDIVGDWSYDASYQFGKTTRENIYRNDFSIVRVGRALDVIDDGSGNAVCRSFADGTDPACVPWNIFSVGGVTPAALGYLQTPGFQLGVVEERVATASVSGPLPLQTPWANEAVTVALGTEYRDERSILEVDQAFATGDLAGQGGATLGSGGQFDVKEFFAEARLPIWQDQPFGKELSVDLGYRFSSYSSIDSTNAYKVGLNYAPVDDIKLRGSYNRAVRAPNIGELASPLNVQLDGSTDPCAGLLTPDQVAAGEVVSGGATRDQCLNDPLIAANPALYGTIRPNAAEQYNGQVGTSPGLKAETADTYTFGFVLTPSFVKGLSFSVDYFNIKVDGYISGYGADTILASCYNSGALCDLINRDPTAGITQGTLWLSNNGYVVDTTTNTGTLLAAGIDFKGDYRIKATDLGLGPVGTFVVDYVGTLNTQQKVSPIPGDESLAYNCVGKYGPQCGAPVSQWRHKLRGSWQMPWYDSAVSLAWRYIGEVEADGSGLNNLRDDKLSGQSYFDLFGSIRLAKKYTVRAGIQNVLDNEPPLVGSGATTSVVGSGNTYPQVYDSMGRFLFTSVTLDF
ncbi:TonB-dependent receptor domain-containing protein [Stagnimonas aquatica]|nr:TonB-dependent receptor [Stagnimonas aquatica]